MKKKKYMIAAIVFCISMVYMIGYLFYKDHFLPNTYINKIDVTNLSADMADERVKVSMLDSYNLKISKKDGRKEYIYGKEIGLNINFDANAYLRNQNSKKWIFDYFKTKNLAYNPRAFYDNTLLNTKIETLSCIKDGKEPKDAYISDYIEDKGYEIVAEDNGSYIDKGLMKKKIEEKIKTLETNIDLVAENCYIKANITSENEALNNRLEKLNQPLKSKIIYDFGEQIVILDPNTYYEWLHETEDGFIIEENFVTEYVDELAKNTNTAYTTRDFNTSNSRIVSVQGPFGYQIDKAAEVKQIISDIESGIETEREPIYTLKGSVRGENDYGNTYVEIDLTNQKVYLYVDGVQLASSSCVTGNISKGHTTPPGIFPLTYKQKNAVLRGPGYASPVKFWMPFNKGIGLHDASWRGSFGGSIYKTNGSHGCINLPYDMAKTLYDHVYQGMPVICYN